MNHALSISEYISFHRLYAHDGFVVFVIFFFIHNLGCNKHASHIASVVIFYAFCYTNGYILIYYYYMSIHKTAAHLNPLEKQKSSQIFGVFYSFSVFLFSLLQSWMSVICAQLFSIESVWFRLIFSNQQRFSNPLKCTFFFHSLNCRNQIYPPSKQ